MSRLLAMICLAVTLVWVVSFLAPLVREGYVPRPEVNGSFLAVLGIFVQLYRKSRNPVVVDDQPEPQELLTKEDPDA